jgi:hypothetical protein
MYESEVDLMQFGDWEQAMRDIGDQDRMTSAWKLSHEMKSFGAEVKQLRVYFDRTAANLAELLESARPK